MALTPARSPALVVGVVLILLSGLRGQEPVREPASKDPYGPRLVAIPFLYYTPETKLAFGAGSVLNFRLGRRKEQTRASTVWAFGTYNLAGQLQVVLRPEVYFERNALFLSGDIRYERTPQKFYGIGNDTPSTDVELFTPRLASFQAGIKRKFLRHFFAGLRFEFEQMTMEKVEPGGLLETGDILGSRGGLLSGFSWSLDWDTRDAVLFPRRGVYLQIVADVFGPLTGSDFTFTGLRLDVRRYALVSSKHVLAMQLVVRSMGGAPPFMRLALLGGESLMRGYYRGRYRDRNMSALQAEYRVPISGRIGIVGFAGLGDVFSSLRDLRLSGLKYSLGSGLRYTVNKREGTNLRLDFAWGRASFGVYFTAQEAF